MKHNKKLKSRINELKEKIKSQQVEIETREECHDYVCKQRDKAMAICQEITFLLLYTEAIQEFIKDDLSNNAKTIRRAIGKFKQELTDGFSSNHLVTQLKIKHKLDNNGVNNNTYEKQI